MTDATSGSVVSLKALGWSLALLLLGSALAAALVFGVLYFERQAQVTHKQAVAQQAETRARLARANDDEREIRGKIARYQEILARGRTAPERRLEWVETLQSIKESRRLLGLEYEVAPQKRLDEKATPVAGYDFFVSQMKLEMPLLHENDLLGLIEDLAAQVEALVSVRRCRLDRLPGPVQRNSPALKAQCDIDWITLQEKT